MERGSDSVLSVRETGQHRSQSKQRKTGNGTQFWFGVLRKRNGQTPKSDRKKTILPFLSLGRYSLSQLGHSSSAESANPATHRICSPFRASAPEDKPFGPGGECAESLRVPTEWGMRWVAARGS